MQKRCTFVVAGGMVMKRESVLVAMSGGVDSSLSAILLHEAGYKVIGLTMKTWDYALAAGATKERGCCSLDTIQDARQVAMRLGIPYYVVDIRDSFGSLVIDYFKEEYLAGRTPNPCVMCNTHIKWNILLEKADKLGCAYVATGHYARVRKEKETYILSKGVDESKDQSYALWGVGQKCLSRTLFPLGEMKKTQTKALASAYGFSHLAQKAESYELCFVPENDYRRFLQDEVEDIQERVSPGELVLSDGKVIGQHKGYPFYTIGQRKGLDIALGYPVYVVDIQKDVNRVVLGTFDELQRKGMYVRGLHWIKPPLEKRADVHTKIRYRDKGTPSVIEQVGDMVKVFFGEAVHAITPGQAAVFYDGADVLGGGWIHAPFQ